MIDKKNISNKVKLAIQVNGKTRDVIQVDNNMDKEKIDEIVRQKSKANKYILNVKINRIVFVKNKIMNYIV